MAEPNPMQEVARDLALWGLRLREAAERDMTRLGATLNGKTPEQAEAAVEEVRRGQRRRRRQLGWPQDGGRSS